MFNLPTYRITPSAHPVKCPPQCPSPRPPPMPPPLVRFPELGVSHVVSPSLIFPTHFLSFPLNPFHYFLYSPNEWDYIMFVLLRLTYFTQHNTLQFHPHWSKWWGFVISNGWVIFLRYLSFLKICLPYIYTLYAKMGIEFSIWGDILLHSYK